MDRKHYGHKVKSDRDSLKPESSGSCSFHGTGSFQKQLYAAFGYTVITVSALFEIAIAQTGLVPHGLRMVIWAPQFSIIVVALGLY